MHCAISQPSLILRVLWRIERNVQLCPIAHDITLGDIRCSLYRLGKSIVIEVLGTSDGSYVKLDSTMMNYSPVDST